MFRIRSGLTQQALADLTGFSLSAIGNWETCQNVPSPGKLSVLATKLAVSIDQLLGHDTEGVTVAPGNPAPPLSSVPQPKIEIRQVPVISWAQAGGFTAWTNQAGAWREFTVTTCSDQNSFGVTVAGDSMEPRFSAGDIAILMPNVEPRNGCLVICKLKNDGVFFKLFHQSGENALIRLSSYNPVYPVMECKPENIVWIYPVDVITKNVWR